MEATTKINLPHPLSKRSAWNEIPLGKKGSQEVHWNPDYSPHMLLCGQVGTGKSVLQRNVFFHLVQHSDRWSFIGIDLKKVELKPYAKYTDVVLGIGTTLEESVKLLKTADQMMRDRYKAMEEKKISHSSSIPAKSVLILIDEAYLLLSPEADEKKDALKREAVELLNGIAMMGRAAGIHLLLATQHFDDLTAYRRLNKNIAAHITLSGKDEDPQSFVGAPEMGRAVFRQHGHYVEPFVSYFMEQKRIDEWLMRDGRMIQV